MSTVNYKPFPDVATWIGPSGTTIPAPEGLEKLIAELVQLPGAVFSKAVRVIRDAAAIETGAIEKLYELDRGMTISAATQGAVLESALAGQPEKVRALIAAQLRAYDFVLDFATRREPLAEAWVRQLHEVLCEGQSHYTVETPDGRREERPLARGRYKEEPNHVRTVSGAMHYYAPVLDVAAEMQRLVEAIKSEAFARLSPVDQAAYAHYCFTVIHPFADGNGRVARALASVFTYRAYRIPLLITADLRSSYFASLEAADNGRYADFRQFTRQRVADSVMLLAESVRVAQIGIPRDLVDDVRTLFLTRGGYSHVAIDQAGHQLLEFATQVLNAEVGKTEHRTPGLTWQVGGVGGATRGLSEQAHRRTLSVGTGMTRVSATLSHPAEASVTVDLAVAVPRNAAEDDDFILECGSERPELALRVPVRSVLPQRSLAADIMITVFLQRLIAQLAGEVAASGRKQLTSRGYP